MGKKQINTISFLIFSSIIVFIYMPNVQEFGGYSSVTDLTYPSLIIIIIILMILFSNDMNEGFLKLDRVIKNSQEFLMSPRENTKFNSLTKQVWIKEKGHNGIALLFNSDKTIEDWYYASSQITLNKVSIFKLKDVGEKSIRISEKDVKNIEKSINNKLIEENFILCSEDVSNSSHIPIAIVTPDLNFEYISANDTDYQRVKTFSNSKSSQFKESALLMDKIYCSEKKILHKIFDKYDKSDLEDCTLLFFNEMAPCTSCLSMLSIEKNINTFKEIKCYYKDILLLFEEEFFCNLNDSDYKTIKKMIEKMKEISEEKRTKLKIRKDIDEF